MDGMGYADCAVPLVAETASRHASLIRYFFSRATATTLDADDESDGIFARWADFGDWQVGGLSSFLREVDVQIALKLLRSKKVSEDWWDDSWTFHGYSCIFNLREWS